MGKVFGREPALIVAAVAAVVQALILFGLIAWTDIQVDGFMAAVNAVLILLAGGVTRQAVFSPQTVADKYEPKHAGS